MSVLGQTKKTAATAASTTPAKDALLDALFNEEETTAPGAAAAAEPGAAVEETFEQQAQSLETPEISTDYKAMFAKIENTKEGGHLEEITSQYLKISDFKMGEKRGFIATGVTQFPNDKTGEMIDAIKLIDEKDTRFICGAAVLVGAVQSSGKNFPFPVIIESNGKQKGKNGDYYSIKVYTV